MIYQNRKFLTRVPSFIEISCKKTFLGRYFQSIFNRRRDKLVSLIKSETLYLYKLPTNLFFMRVNCSNFWSRNRQGLRKAPVVQEYFFLCNKNLGTESGWFRLFSCYRRTFSRITEKYDVTPLSTQLPAHSSPSFTELPHTALQVAFVQSRIAVHMHVLACALLFSTQNWVPRW